MKITRALLFVLTLAAASALAQQAQERPADVPTLAPTGSLTATPETMKEMLAGVKAPEGFRVDVFAAPPEVNYPACLTATLTGEVFVCVDRNSSLQTAPDMGSVLRLVDKDGDGRAETYTIFARMDSPRGAAFDGQTLYVVHPPNVTAYRDTNGDGIADDSRTLIRGLGFDLTFRGADHTTNGVTLGIDGWLYIAVGDYGFVKAVGADGREAQMRGGGHVRVRTDGSGLEIYARGTRNDYDVAVDPYLNLFARGNTNDGGGWDVRLNHFVAGGVYGYPSLFRHFGDEVIPPLADYGGGSGAGALYIQDPGLPAPYGDTLYTADWGTSNIYRHPLQPKGATFTAGQEIFLGIQRPTDLTIDGASRMFVASWRGGQYRYQGEQIGYIARLTHASAKPSQIPDLAAADDLRLVELVVSGNHVHRLFAQQELLRRGRTPARVSLLEQRVLGAGSVASRVAAIFTLKQLAGTDAHATLLKAAGDAAVRAFALRALADRPREVSTVPSKPFVDALSDKDPRVQLEAITGLRRLGATDTAASILALTSSTDPVLPHVAVEALVGLRATDAALRVVTTGTPAAAKGALRVLQRLHDAPTVTGLIQALGQSKSPEIRTGILQALARLYHRDGVWRGTTPEWWSTRPDTTGPYYDPVSWEESPRIAAVLQEAVTRQAGSVNTTTFLRDLERNRLLPPGGQDLLAAMMAAKDPALDEVTEAILGDLRLDPANVPLLDRLTKQSPAYHGPVVKIIAAGGTLTAESADILQRVAVNAKGTAEVRASALNALATAAGPEARSRSVDAFASLSPGPGLDPALDRAWRQYVSATAHADQVNTFAGLATSNDPSRQVLGYAVLLQLAIEPPAARGGSRSAGGGRAAGAGGAAAGARGGAAAGAGGARGGARGFGARGARGGASAADARDTARKAIESGWSGPNVASLLRAIGLTEAAGYDDQIKAQLQAASAEVREAAKFASTNTRATAAAGAGGGAGAALVSTVPVEELAGRMAALKGDATLGQTLFTRQACATCHTASPEEALKGPYLGGISQRYNRAELIDSIVRPAATVAQGFATNYFEMKDGRQLSGFIIQEGTTEVVIRDIAGTETKLAKNAIANRGVLEGSVMPPGLVDSLTLQEFASLLAYLDSLKSGN
jgi:putative heme-binding domain-containing protein